MRPIPVYLHVGLKKTGTSYLQGVAWASQDELTRQGLAMVPESHRAGFELMRDARGHYDDEADAARIGGSVARLPEMLRHAAEQGATRALFTQESLSMASSAEVVGLLRTLDGHELHLVLTVRDLARQVPSAWQQAVKAGRSISFDDYVSAVVAGTGAGASAFRRSQDVVDVCDRWAAALAPERVHVVTVPQRPAPPTLLAHRFFGAVGVSAETLTTDVSSVNPSIGRLQAELLARINASLPGEARRRVPYGQVAKRYFAGRVLRAQGGAPAQLPREREEWCRAASERTIATLTDRGYTVAGDLTDLIPSDDAFAVDPVLVDEPALLAVAELALSRMLVDRMEQGGRVQSRTPGVTPDDSAPRGVVRRTWGRALGRSAKR